MQPLQTRVQQQAQVLGHTRRAAGWGGADRRDGTEGHVSRAWLPKQDGHGVEVVCRCRRLKLDR